MPANSLCFTWDQLSENCNNNPPPLIAATLADFDGLWDVLIPAERSRLVHLLVERAVCSADSDIQAVFRTIHPK